MIFLDPVLLCLTGFEIEGFFLPTMLESEIDTQTVTSALEPVEDALPTSLRSHDQGISPQLQDSEP